MLSLVQILSKRVPSNCTTSLYVFKIIHIYRYLKASFITMKPFLCHNCLVLNRCMKNTLTFLLILSSITYGIGQNVIKPTLLGGISGTIQDAKNGKPVPGATVMLYAKSNTKNNKIITSDKNGEFLFEKIPLIPLPQYSISLPFSDTENDISLFSISILFSEKKFIKFG